MDRQLSHAHMNIGTSLYYFCIELQGHMVHLDRSPRLRIAHVDLQNNQVDNNKLVCDFQPYTMHFLHTVVRLNKQFYTYSDRIIYRSNSLYRFDTRSFDNLLLDHQQNQLYNCNQHCDFEHYIQHFVRIMFVRHMNFYTRNDHTNLGHNFR